MKPPPPTLKMKLTSASYCVSVSGALPTTPFARLSSAGVICRSRLNCDDAKVAAQQIFGFGLRDTVEKSRFGEFWDQRRAGRLRDEMAVADGAEVAGVVIGAVHARFSERFAEHFALVESFRASRPDCDTALSGCCSVRLE